MSVLPDGHIWVARGMHGKCFSDCGHCGKGIALGDCAGHKIDVPKMKVDIICDD